MIGPLASFQLDSKMDTQTIRDVLNPLIASDVMFCNDDVEGYLHPASLLASREAYQTARTTNSSYRLSPMLPPSQRTIRTTTYNVQRTTYPRQFARALYARNNAPARVTHFEKFGYVV